MKEMMIRLPMIEMAASDNSCLAKHYPKSGRYIIRRDNGDTSVVDVQLRPVNAGEARCDDEQATVYECFLGQPDLFDPDDWALAIDIENAKLAARADVENIKCEMEDLKSEFEDKVNDERREKEKAIVDMKADMEGLRSAMQADCDAKCEALRKECDERVTKMQAELESRKKDLEHEYAMKEQQLELSIPKRFSQGEWVSGKTLTEIIKVLSEKNND